MTEEEIMLRLYEIALRQSAIGTEYTAAQMSGGDTAALVAETTALNAEEAELRGQLPAAVLA